MVTVRHEIERSPVYHEVIYPNTATLDVDAFQFAKQNGFNPFDFATLKGSFKSSSQSYINGGNTIRFSGCTYGTDDLVRIRYRNSNASVSTFSIDRPLTSDKVDLTTQEYDIYINGNLKTTTVLPYRGSWTYGDKLSIIPKAMTGYTVLGYDIQSFDGVDYGICMQTPIPNTYGKGVVIKGRYDKVPTDYQADYRMFSGSGANNVKQIKITDMEVGTSLISAVVFRVPFTYELVTGKSTIPGMDMVVSIYDLLSKPNYIPFYLMLRVVGVTQQSVAMALDKARVQMQSDLNTNNTKTRKFKLIYNSAHLYVKDEQAEYTMDLATNTEKDIEIFVNPNTEITKISATCMFAPDKVLYPGDDNRFAYSSGNNGYLKIMATDLNVMFQTSIKIETRRK